MSYEELKKVLRTGYPGLEVTTDQVTDNQIRGLWRGLDDDLSGEVSVQEFMIFFRRHGREHSMFKPTDHDLASRAVHKSKFYSAPVKGWFSTQVARSAQRASTDRKGGAPTGEIKIDSPGSKKEPPQILSEEGHVPEARRAVARLL